MYNLMKYDSNYSETTESLWFYCKDEVTNSDADIANTNHFKSFKCKVKLLRNTVAQPAPNQANGILKNAIFAAPLKYLSNSWRSLGIALINCKVELKFKLTMYCVLSAAGNENNINEDSNVNNIIIFTIRETKLYVPVETLSARDNQKLSKLLSKGFERSVYWNEYRTKSENKNTANE